MAIQRIRNVFKRLEITPCEAEQWQQGVFAANTGQTPQPHWTRYQLAGYTAQASALAALHMPPVQMPADVRQRVRRRVLAETRRLRHRLLVRRVAMLVAVMLALATMQADAQVWCDPCPPTVWLPIVFGEVR